MPGDRAVGVPKGAKFLKTNLKFLESAEWKHKGHDGCDYARRVKTSIGKFWQRQA
jgi:hypothetical protein